MQHEHVLYLAFAIIREHELLVEILSSCLPYEFSPESAAALSLSCLSALLDFLLYRTHVCIGEKWIAFCTCWRLKHATQKIHSNLYLAVDYVEVVFSQVWQV